MPEYGPPIDQFVNGDRVEDVPVHVVEASQLKTQQGKPFARYLLRDRTGVIAGVRWDYELPANEAGAAALLSGQVSEYNGTPQVKVADLLVLPEPEPEFLDRLSASQASQREPLLLAILEQAHRSLPAVFWQVFVDSVGHDPFDTSGPFWTFAAAQSKHHAERGGLAWHVLTMLAHVDSLSTHYPGLDVDLLKLAVLCHDLGKLDCYEMGALGARRLEADRIVGHTSYSMQRVYTAIAAARARGLEFSRADEESLLHAIAGHHGRREWGAVVEPVTPEAAALHALDLLDSQIRGGLDNRVAPLPDRGAPAAPAAPTKSSFDDDPFEDDLVPARQPRRRRRPDDDFGAAADNSPSPAAGFDDASAGDDPFADDPAGDDPFADDPASSQPEPPASHPDQLSMFDDEG